MTTTVVAQYNKLAKARSAANELVNSRFNREEISIFGADAEGEYSVEMELVAAGSGGRSRDDAYEGDVEEDVLVVAQVADVAADKALEILDRHAPVRSAAQGARWNASEWTHLERDAKLYSADAAGPEEARYRDALYRASQSGGQQRARGANESAAIAHEFEDLEEYFKTHYVQNFEDTQYSYEDYRPAYRYGYFVGISHAGEDREWDAVETKVRDFWEQENQSPWDVMQSAIFEGWLAGLRQRESAVG